MNKNIDSMIDISLLKSPIPSKNNNTTRLLHKKEDEEIQYRYDSEGQTGEQSEISIIGLSTENVQKLSLKYLLDGEIGDILDIKIKENIKIISRNKPPESYAADFLIDNINDNKITNTLLLDILSGKKNKSIRGFLNQKLKKKFPSIKLEEPQNEPNKPWLNASSNVLDTAIEESNYYIIELFVKILNAKNILQEILKVKTTLLISFIELGREEIVDLFIKSEADVSIADSNGKTPLHYAADSGHTSVVRLLIEKGANVKAFDKKGDTAMCWAVFRGYKDIIKLLAQKDPKFHSKKYCESCGLSAIEWAQKQKFTDIVDILKSSQRLSSDICSTSNMDDVGNYDRLSSGRDEHFSHLDKSLSPDF